MNKKALIIAGSLLILLAVGGIVYVFYPKEPAPTPSGNTDPFGSIGGGPSDLAYTVSGQGNEAIKVNDFIRNGETASDPLNPGSYFLAGDIGYCLADGNCPHGAETDTFQISYDEDSSTFSVALTAEPLSTARMEAETFLMERLGVDAATLCRLNYFVSTTYWVNESYANRNLGFSSCSGSVQLP
ncbi:MAG TPA: hypothetical protein VFY28_01185 [Candidatus Paceibacterota bacterium]|nr:hypothetical protein [Candidatus Paceibacterota bacterium]